MALTALAYGALPARATDIIAEWATIRIPPPPALKLPEMHLRQSVSVAPPMREVGHHQIQSEIHKRRVEYLVHAEAECSYK